MTFFLWQNVQILINPSETSEIRFFNLVTLTLDLRTHPRYYQGKHLHQILGLYVKRFSRESAHRQTHTRTHTHTQTGPILCPRPLTREGIIPYLYWTYSIVYSLFQRSKNRSSSRSASQKSTISLASRLSRSSRASRASRASTSGYWSDCGYMAPPRPPPIPRDIEPWGLIYAGPVHAWKYFSGTKAYWTDIQQCINNTSMCAI